MLADAEAAGCKLYLVSGYRSVRAADGAVQAQDKFLHGGGLQPGGGRKQVAMRVARPGTRSITRALPQISFFGGLVLKHSDLTADFEDTPEFEWLYAHCADYGFILRYPRGKENVTGVTYEPWHYRYVGKDAAKAIMQAGGTWKNTPGRIPPDAAARPGKRGGYEWRS